MPNRHWRQAYHICRASLYRTILILLITAVLLLTPASVNAPGFFTLGASKIGGFDVLR